MILSMLLKIRIYELICLNWFLWVKKFIFTLLENLDRMVLRLKMTKFYFGPWFMKISVWSLNFGKITIWPLNVFWDSGQCYYEVIDDESQFDNWFGIFLVWSLNFENLHFSPWTFWKLQFGPWFVLDRIDDGLWVKISVWLCIYSLVQFW